MIRCKALESEVLSKATITNRKKAIQNILFDTEIKNKAVKNMVVSATQKTFSVVEANSKITSSIVAFSEIYDILKKEYPSGYLPVVIANIIKNNMEYLVIEKEENEVSISLETIEKITNSPELYTLKKDENIEDCNKYLEIFKGSCKGNIFESTLKSMQQWLFNLSKYASCTERIYKGQGKYLPIDSKAIKFRDSLKGIQNNPYWYVTSYLPKIFDSYQDLKETKSFIDSIVSELLKKIHEDIVSVFQGSIYKWYENLSSEIKTIIHEEKEEEFLEVCREDTYSQKEIIEKLCFILTGLEMKNWNDGTPTLFYKELVKIKNNIESYQNESFENSVKLTFSNVNGNEIKKTLEIVPLEKNPSAKLFVKDLGYMFKEYGYNLSHKEKLSAILLNFVLKDESWYIK